MLQLLHIEIIFFFHLYQRDKSAGSRALFRQASSRCKRVIESAKNRYVEKKRNPLFLRRFALVTFGVLLTVF